MSSPAAEVDSVKYLDASQILFGWCGREFNLPAPDGNSLLEGLLSQFDVHIEPSTTCITGVHSAKMTLGLWLPELGVHVNAFAVISENSKQPLVVIVLSGSFDGQGRTPLQLLEMTAEQRQEVDTSTFGRREWRHAIEPKDLVTPVCWPLVLPKLINETLPLLYEKQKQHPEGMMPLHEIVLGASAEEVTPQSV